MSNAESLRIEVETAFIETLRQHTTAFVSVVGESKSVIVCGCGYEAPYPITGTGRIRAWAEHVAEVLGVTHKRWDAYLAAHPEIVG